jgi:hypothetical protein
MRFLPIAAALACLLPGAAWGQVSQGAVCSFNSANTGAVACTQSGLPMPIGTNAMGTGVFYFTGVGAAGATVLVQTAPDNKGPSGPHWTTAATVTADGPQPVNLVGANVFQINVSVAGSGPASVNWYLQSQAAGTGTTPGGGGTFTANPPALTPSAAKYANSVAAAGTLQTIFDAAYCTNGEYVNNTSSAPLCVATYGQTGSLSCPATAASGDNLIVVQPSVSYPFNRNVAYALSITGSITGQTFTKGCY